MSENNTQKVNKRIEEIYEGMKDLNVYKNTQYIAEYDGKGNTIIT